MRLDHLGILGRSSDDLLVWAVFEIKLPTLIHEIDAFLEGGEIG